MLQLPSSHDIRRGAARDIAYLPVQQTAVNIEAARLSLNHTTTVRDAGLTEDYVDPEVDAVWEERLQKPNGSKRQKKIEFSDETFKRLNESLPATLTRK
ncbi:hypothetical protein NLG97_g2303 [Lecanicillium saksenae]|uniref:Uncharacterized protein n=1 Tax=Lecanicillium saksenae TaxID=468837 RepID=A0ACC1R180_9HYPO|nr:hypothetical protein NLG97_g2303 [Lecanicillium saksenae]